jgi:ferredoxin
MGHIVRRPVDFFTGTFPATCYNAAFNSQPKEVMPAKVDITKCEACDDCVNACPTQAITIENDKAKVDESACSDCGLCVDTCTKQAISMA